MKRLDKKKKGSAVHPGRILLQEFMEPAGISQYKLAQSTGLSRMHISNLIKGTRNISAETALRLEEALGMSARTWMNLQTLYDLETAMQEEGRAIKRSTQRIDLTVMEAAAY